MNNFRKLINPVLDIFKISLDANRTGIRGWDDFGGVVKLKKKNDGNEKKSVKSNQDEPNMINDCEIENILISSRGSGHSSRDPVQLCLVIVCPT